MKIKAVQAKEIWVNSQRAGFIVEDWFYPAPNVQLSVTDLLLIMEEMYSEMGVDWAETILYKGWFICKAPKEISHLGFYICDRKTKGIDTHYLHPDGTTHLGASWYKTISEAQKVIDNLK